jgi:hypothetical protein
MQHKKIELALVFLVSSVAIGTAQASLLARTGGMVYDNVNNLTWASNANLFQTQAAGNTNLVNEIIAANGGVIHNTPNYFDNGTHNLTSADFNTGTGQMTWWGAKAWVNSLTLGGVTGWSLPTTPVITNMLYDELGGATNRSIVTTHNGNYNLFNNIQSCAYWSSSEASNLNSALIFYTSYGLQGFAIKNSQFLAWAVQSGDVAIPPEIPKRPVPPITTVPVPGALWLFGSGLIGFMGLKRRGNIG